jgi:peptide chain release factor subunit 1
MEKTTVALATPLREQLDRLAAFEAVEWPVLSLYLDLRADQQGRENYDTFLRKALPERGRGLARTAKASFDRDVERIRHYLDFERRASSNGLALFACSAIDGFFEAMQFNVPALDGHSLFIDSVPHLYPLARLNDQYPRYAALLVDTNSARLFVFSLAAVEKEQRVSNVKTKRTSMGGTAQARYQRHIDNFHLLHIKEVLDVLERVVRAEKIGRIVVAGDEPARSMLLKEMPEHLTEKVIDTLSLNIRTAQHEVLAETLDALRRKDADTDAAQVEAMLGAWRAGGLAVAGLEATRQALTLGEVEELLITARPAPNQADVANELVTRAQQNSARIRFIEDAALLSQVEGVGALLRFRAG